MRRRASAWIVVAAAVLAGCAIGPDYTRPAVANPDRFRGQAAVEAASLADAPWWEVFQDLILRDLIHEALRNNYGVSIAAARVREARANLIVARSDFYPSLDYSAAVSIAQWEQAKLQYEQAVLTALREVSDALTALGKNARTPPPSDGPGQFRFHLEESNTPRGKAVEGYIYNESPWRITNARLRVQSVDPNGTVIGPRRSRPMVRGRPQPEERDLQCYTVILSRNRSDRASTT